MANIELRGISKTYGAGAAVDDINLAIGEGEFFSLLGPSGCGKSTMLRMIAGFITPSHGRVLIGGEDVTDLPPEKRNVGIVFQNYAIFPHLNVFENVAFGLRLRKVGREEIKARAAAVLDQVGLSGYGERFQRQLSGGEQQRVALARVLVTEPKILLLDEPLSALDKNKREEMKVWIQEMQKRLSITTVYVTHDQDEALTMSDRIAVMNKGKIAQIGSPTEIYEQPRSAFVTNFVGHSNLLDVTVVSGGETPVVSLGETHLSAHSETQFAGGQAAQLAVRPENVVIDPPADYVRLRAIVTSETYQGPIIRYRADVAGQEITIERQNQAGLVRYAPGAEITIGWAPQRSSLLPIE
jgi:putative spermidine/putrescine transport system ATP-binding protein